LTSTLGSLKEIKIERHSKNGKMMCFVQFEDERLAEMVASRRFALRTLRKSNPRSHNAPSHHTETTPGHPWGTLQACGPLLALVTRVVLFRGLFDPSTFFAQGLAKLQRYQFSPTLKGELDISIIFAKNPLNVTRPTAHTTKTAVARLTAVEHSPKTPHSPPQKCLTPLPLCADVEKGVEGQKGGRRSAGQGVGAAEPTEGQGGQEGHR